MAEVDSAVTTSRSYRRPIDASEERSVLTEHPGTWLGITDISPDGRHAIFQRDTDLNPSVSRLDLVYGRLDDSAAVSGFETTVQDEYGARFSPDGRWVAYVSEESGRPHVYTRPFPSGPRLQVSEQPAGMPVWDPAGDRLYYRTDRGLMAADLAESGSALRVAGRELLFDRSFSGSVGMWVATYDVHSEGFVMAIDEFGVEGQIVVWTDWLHELDPLLER